jgi:hypothetical protein
MRQRKRIPTRLWDYAMVHITKLMNMTARGSNGRTGHEEITAIARRGGKHGGIKLVEKAIKREQGKQAKLPKKHEKVARAKKVADTDSDSSEESMDNLESRIPRKKTTSIKNVRLNTKGEVVDIEDSEDSEDDRKKPAKISSKKTKKVADSIDLDSESSKDEIHTVNKEEKVFLKSIGVINDKEEYILSSDSESD